MTTPTPALCPHCRQLDAVRKVRAIVTEGVSVGHYQSIAPLQLQGQTYYLPTQRETSSSTLLAQRLAPPLQPKKPNKTDYSYLKYASASFKAKRNAISFTMAILLLLVSCGIAAVVASLVEGAGGWILGFLIWLGIVIGGAILMSFFLVLLGQMFPPFGKTMLDVFGAGKIEVVKQAKATQSAEIFRLQARADRDYQWALRQYEMYPVAVQRWNELYYCARDDGVFLQGGRLVQVEQMQSLLYE
jgi:hypothetical protein